jgi:hypothetical protein
MTRDQPDDVIALVGEARGWPEEEVDDLVRLADDVGWEDSDELDELADILATDPDVAGLPGAAKLSRMFSEAAGMEDHDSIASHAEAFADDVLLDIHDAAKAASSPWLWGVGILGAAYLFTRK